MPGTGKTNTIACTIEILVSLGKSIFLTSYTNTAVDNLLLKLVKTKVDFVRLGNNAKVSKLRPPRLILEISEFRHILILNLIELPQVHPELQSMVSPEKGAFKTVADYEKYFSSKQVVATTCLGINQ
jgi:DNA replication ATP-dependent helicase Dna2